MAVSSRTSALRFYQVCSTITGVLLLLLCAEMVAKYVFGYELELAGSEGVLALVPSGTVTAVNVSTAILIVHGWFYVVYLVSGLRLWSLMRWPLVKFLLIALGGIVPCLSFFLESWFSRQVGNATAVSTALVGDDVKQEQEDSEWQDARCSRS